VQVDRRRRGGRTEVQQRPQALASGQHLGVAAVAAEGRQGLVQRGWRVVLELGWFHCSGVLEAGLDRGWPEKGACGSDTPVLTLCAPISLCAPIWPDRSRSRASTGSWGGR